MNPQEYEKLKLKFEEERKEAYANLKTAEGKLAGLEEAYKYGNKSDKRKGKRGSRKNKPVYAYDPSQDVNKTDIMREALKHFGDSAFKTKNFIAYLKENHPDVKISDTFVSNTIGKFIKQGRIEIVNKGEKKKGYVYKRKTG